MNELNVIPDGAVLIRNGVIEDVGPSRRVENLAGARNAKEIDANGGIVMPGFVDADAVLVFPRSPLKLPEPSKEVSLRVLSRRRLEFGATAAAADWAQYGTLTVGAHTGYAFDLSNVAKVLRVHRSCQSRPLRIRSILAPRLAPGGNQGDIERAAATLLANLTRKWLPAIRRRKLAGIVEFTVDREGRSLALGQIREAAVVAAGLGYAIRLRALEPLQPDANDLAVAAGAVALIAPPDPRAGHDSRLDETGCVRVLSAADALRDDRGAPRAIRRALDQGCAFAVASGYQACGHSTYNPQFLLHLACARLGFTPEEAIVATTYNAACSLRMSHVTGSLEPGKSADVVVMAVPDYRELARRPGHSDVHFVIRAGQPVFRRASLILD